MNFEKNAVVYYNKEDSRYVEAPPKYEIANNQDFAKELSKRLDLNCGDVNIVLKAFEDLVCDYLSITTWDQNTEVWVTKNICLRSAYDPEHLVAYEEDKEYRVVPEGFDFEVAFTPEFEEKCLKRLSGSRYLKEAMAKLKQTYSQEENDKRE